MNKHFATGNGWPGYPKDGYGRLDHVEPPNLEGAAEAVFAFDVVDAGWLELQPGGRFDLANPELLAVRQAEFWKQMFGTAADRPSDPYERAPVYRVDISVERSGALFKRLCEIDEETWVHIRLGDRQPGEKVFPAVEVYGGLFAEPIRARLIKIVPEANLAKALSAAFDMDQWPDAATNDIARALAAIPEIDRLVAYDVGQGAANALVDTGETALLFFDLGQGVYANKGTSPKPLRFCWRGSPPVVLSHWDADHWAGGASDPAASARTWVAPRQKIGATHALFVAHILRLGGTVSIWGASPATISVLTASGQTLTFARCTGSGRNFSGIALLAEDPATSGSWLLTGDAGYTYIPIPLGTPTAITVPHHGADMGPTGAPPPKGSGYRRLIYSFGHGNRHGLTKVRHPTQAAVMAHAAWNHGAWAVPTPGHVTAGGEVLATATHPSTHEDGAAVSWTAAPFVPFTTVPCATGAASTSGCTGAVRQA